MLSPKWAAQVLAQRGIRPPEPDLLNHALSALDQDAQDELSVAIRKFEQGVDSSADFGLIESFLAKAKTTSATSNKEESIANVGEDEDTWLSVGGGDFDDLSWLPESDLPDFEPARGRSARAKATTQTDEEKNLAWMRSHGLHIYGSKSALKAELDTPRQSGAWLGQYTVSFDMAPSTSANRYDWDVKLSFQLTKRELPLLAAFLLGFAGTELSFPNHGPDRNKTLELKDQCTHFFIKIRQGHAAYAMPVSAPDHFGLTSLVMTAMRLNAPDLDGMTQIAMLKQVGRMRQALLQKGG